MKIFRLVVSALLLLSTPAMAVEYKEYSGMALLEQSVFDSNSGRMQQFTFDAYESLHQEVRG
ncbi:hypothetical protein NIES2107_59450 [Nostoc carneum NIES-2107]|nr:hypothetical protein NIES2107_59450 [Nostoc carneum NIES-2107]